MGHFTTYANLATPDRSKGYTERAVVNYFHRLAPALTPVRLSAFGCLRDENGWECSTNTVDLG